MIGSAPLTGNFAYIDNQNMYMSTTKCTNPWNIDMRRFRVYLRDKYNVLNAYLFMGAFEAKRQPMYSAFQECGYIVYFREHGAELKGRKKGNVDVDIVFEMMRDSFYSAQMEKAILVSGDGDYYKVVDHLICNNKFEKLLLPSQENASSLYKTIPEAYKAYLDTESMRKKIGRK